jgi:hypothetical protein
VLHRSSSSSRQVLLLICLLANEDHMIGSTHTLSNDLLKYYCKIILLFEVVVVEVVRTSNIRKNDRYSVQGGDR